MRLRLASQNKIEMAYTVIWSVEAETTYANLLNFLEERWSDRQINRFIERSEEVIRFIGNNPLMYPCSKTREIHRAVISKQTSLYYYITGEVVVLLSFEDNRQNPKRSKY
ncbi:type II toxin-antitoxin system RelE/ParE family toxin [Tunicatimonas pelagia]|uniref:type II toxin-antitoxin system RelE/ParE family toxin n=1 Tax=Tunicatimonas pelagia TaxID=931531 RepID=UPI002666CA4E|nr:type II toxin-antitoxin system RelE/ParE family toxin [Tunicatimonas pelagia]WKN40740.1 type II toxin-antitoxin system RelE/ParE family toxin [Tunicatimonas pelagia]